jgi:lipopolysaccharide transport system permease protein
MQLVIEAGKTEGLYWRDLWRYRELFYFMAWRDILVRYKQTVVGIAWSVVRPLLTMLVFTFVFQKLAKMPSDGDVPYPVLIFAALVPWQFFANALTECSNSLILNTNLVSKVYFPRIILPTSAVIVSFVDLLISLVLLVILMLAYHVAPDWHILALPGFMLLAFAAAMGAGYWLAALNVKYRDFRYVVPFIAQFGFYMSPVGYSITRVPEKWRLLFALNPMVGPIDGFRWAILRGKSPLYPPGIVVSALAIGLIFASSLWYFRRTERKFADII